MKSLACRYLFVALPITIAWVLAGCGSSPTNQSPVATPPPSPQAATGSFAVTNSVPGPGGVINLPTNLPHAGPDLTFQFTFSSDIPRMHWEIDLFQGSQKCLATQSAYATRLDGGPSSGYYAEYRAGSTAIFRSDFWVLQDCGTAFLVDHLLFTVIGDTKELFRQTANMAWTFRPPGALPVPTQLTPPSGALLSGYPRLTTLQWSPIADPSGVWYRAEIEFQNPLNGLWLPLPLEVYGSCGGHIVARSCQFTFVGANPGRWRVWAEDGAGNTSAKSDWWFFRYLD